MMHLPRPVPAPRYPTGLRYPDVDDDVLAQEDADEPCDGRFAWPAELRCQPAADAAPAGRPWEG